MFRYSSSLRVRPIEETLVDAGAVVTDVCASLDTAMARGEAI